MKQKGFTLLEILVALAVGAILLGVAVPSLLDFVRNARRTTSANELLSTLHTARELAITRNARVTVCPTVAGAACEAVGWNRGWIVFVDADADRTVDADEPVQRSAAGAPGLTLTTLEFPQFLLYRPNGRVMVDDVDDNTGEFVLCDVRGAAQARVVLIDESGRPRVSTETLAGVAPSCG